MMNDFLSDILKVVIVLGVIAYFLLGLKTKSQPETVSATAHNADEPVDEDLFGPGFLNPAAAAIQSPSPRTCQPHQLLETLVVSPIQAKTVSEECSLQRVLTLQ
jgi:hypothetical protein